MQLFVNPFIRLVGKPVLTIIMNSRDSDAEHRAWRILPLRRGSLEGLPAALTRPCRFLSGTTQLSILRGSIVARLIMFAVRSVAKQWGGSDHATTDKCRDPEQVG